MNDPLRAHILKKVEEKEFEDRCIRARICPFCGDTLKVIEGLISAEALQCTGKQCRKYFTNVGE
jgi:hypothetical protein